MDNKWVKMGKTRQNWEKNGGKCVKMGKLGQNGQNWTNWEQKSEKMG